MGEWMDNFSDIEMDGWMIVVFLYHSVLSDLTHEQSTNLKDSHRGCSVHHAEEACHSPLEVSGRVPPFVTDPTVRAARKKNSSAFLSTRNLAAPLHPSRQLT